MIFRDYSSFLEKRLKALEKKMNQLSASSNGGKAVRSFLSTNLNVGGFFESGFSAFAQESGNLQLSISSIDEDLDGVHKITMKGLE
ncbi:MAG: hypothetical protein JST80_10280 [Bdellovibrionales bacterium]|nr:hypothetical protein [Bdellovibrionales bacterium]